MSSEESKSIESQLKETIQHLKSQIKAESSVNLRLSQKNRVLSQHIEKYSGFESSNLRNRITMLQRKLKERQRERDMLQNQVDVLLKGGAGGRAIEEDDMKEKESHRREKEMEKVKEELKAMRTLRREWERRDQRDIVTIFGKECTTYLTGTTRVILNEGSEEWLEDHCEVPPVISGESEIDPLIQRTKLRMENIILMLKKSEEEKRLLPRTKGQKREVMDKLPSVRVEKTEKLVFNLILNLAKQLDDEIELGIKYKDEIEDTERTIAEKVAKLEEAAGSKGIEPLSPSLAGSSSFVTGSTSSISSLHEPRTPSKKLAVRSLQIENNDILDRKDQCKIELEEMIRKELELQTQVDLALSDFELFKADISVRTKSDINHAIKILRESVGEYEEALIVAKTRLEQEPSYLR
ncbi:hypothetical protein ADUPG1_006633 [Aduncisulcus paluster]|uniref:Uncharacterized protein n=1 Tax=Aduncisulcus paluster TaxID=2918883 RepID=A0ABQ5KIZ1_9EUKA|nr:hypothetical protein ADUPG1_006633 [Aduncisulcus paluster]